MKNNFEKETWKEFSEAVVKKKLILFGASRGCIKFFRDYGELYEVYSIVDNDPKKWGVKFAGIEIKSPQILLDEIGNDTVILITSIYIEEISIQLEQLGMKTIFSFLFIRRHGVNWDIYESDYEQIHFLRKILYDEKSKAIFDKIIYKRKEKLVNYLDIREYHQYFDSDIMVPKLREVFIDCGAYDGDTINRFLKWLKHDNYVIYAMEPDEDNYNKICESYRYNDRVHHMNIGVWSKETEIRFNNGNSMESNICENGETIVKCNSLDNIFIDSSQKVTFIKMDIEGAELEAITGAKNIIQRDKPKLAICIYHKRDDLWKIPLMIHEMVSEYRIYIRHYNSDIAETVLYAVI